MIALHSPLEVSTHSLKQLWLFNFGLLAFYIILVLWVPFMKGAVLEYPNARPIAFDGTTSPIAYVPNWLNAANLVKTLRYENIAASEFVATPFYDPEVFGNEDPRDKAALLARGTYITPYMGSYRMNFREYDGSHLGVDIRAPLGTPVLSIANGVVIKSVNTQWADGKYVIIRHDGVSYSRLPPASYYSAYLHLEVALPAEGTVIKKGELIGRVGMSGITTTPHLHLQIDTSDAPFHSYWPYSFKDLRELKLDFFEAVNAGLGKENAIKYTVNPLDFIQSLETGVINGAPSTSVPAPVDIPVSAVTPPAAQTFIASVSVATPTPSKTATLIKTTTPTPAREPLFAAPTLPTTTVSLPVSASTAAVRASQAYIDIPARANYARAAQYLKDRAIPVLSNETVFRPTQAMTRREAVLLLAGVFNVESQPGATSSFADILADDPALGYIATLQARGVIKSGWIFRPNESITKQELIALMLRITGDYQASIDTYGEGGPIQEFVRTTSFGRARTATNKPVVRSEAARMIELWGRMGV
jgi:murein DD-endopeptidase MepM/ murein hydrolase activator NlpD